MGTLCGPLIAGGIVENTTWRWLFCINLPFYGIALVAIPIFVKLRLKPTSLRSKLASVDWIGGVLFIAGMTSFLIAITWGGVQFEWSSFKTVVPLVLGIIGVALAALWERYQAEEPFLRLLLFSSISPNLAYCMAIFQGLLVRLHALT